MTEIPQIWLLETQCEAHLRDLWYHQLCRREEALTDTNKQALLYSKLMLYRSKVSHRSQQLQDSSWDRNQKKSKFLPKSGTPKPSTKQESTMEPPTSFQLRTLRRRWFCTSSTILSTILTFWLRIIGQLWLHTCLKNKTWRSMNASQTYPGTMSHQCKWDDCLFIKTFSFVTVHQWAFTKRARVKLRVVGHSSSHRCNNEISTKLCSKARPVYRRTTRMHQELLSIASSHLVAGKMSN